MYPNFMQFRRAFVKLQNFCWQSRNILMIMYETSPGKQNGDTSW